MIWYLVRVKVAMFERYYRIRAKDRDAVIEIVRGVESAERRVNVSPLDIFITPLGEVARYSQVESAVQWRALPAYDGGSC